MARGSARGRRHCLAFTLVEIALSLAIVGFALVAIIGVLPTGMNVQKENREETIINQDGRYLLEAIRSGARGLDDLTNYVDSVIITNVVFEDGRVVSRRVEVYTNDVRAPFDRGLYSGQRIVGLLTTPKLVFAPDGRVASNIVVAYVRSITGLASEKSVNNPNAKDFAFRYMLRSEVLPFATYTNAPSMANELVETPYDDQLRMLDLRNNLYDLRLTLNWPVFERGGRVEVGSNRKTFRTLVPGEVGEAREQVGGRTYVYPIFVPYAYKTRY